MTFDLMIHVSCCQFIQVPVQKFNWPVAL